MAESEEEQKNLLMKVKERALGSGRGGRLTRSGPGGGRAAAGHFQDPRARGARRCRDSTPEQGRAWIRKKKKERKKVKESEKPGLKFNIQKTKIMASSAITSWQILGKNGN